MNTKKKNILIFLFKDVEVLDFAGPFEVFSVAGELSGSSLMNIRTVARSRAPIRARNGLSVIADLPLDEAPAPDILIIPGGAGTRAILQDKKTLSWISAAASAAEKTLSICTGALILAQIGLLSGLEATTHHENLAELADLAPGTTIKKNVRFVDNGRILTSGGISAGIDMCLHVVEVLYGKDLAQKTAAYMEYNRGQAANRQQTQL